MAFKATAIQFSFAETVVVYASSEIFNIVIFMVSYIQYSVIYEPIEFRRSVSLLLF